MEDQPNRGSSAPFYLLGALFAAGVLVLAAWNIRLPYLAFSAGPVSDAADAIVAEGVPVYPPEGELLMLTVVSQDVNIFEALIVGLDPTLDLVPREAYRRPEESDKDYRARVLAQMDDSQEVSIEVALEYLGYQMVPTGVLVTDISADVPAATVLEIGDEVHTLDGEAISGFEDLSAALSRHQPGDLVELGIVRQGSSQQVVVELAQRQDEIGGPMLGISVHQLRKPPFPLSIEAGVVGGPSAGMMHTLAIIDTLTAGEMTKGHVIAGTGTIRADGTVGTIGGVRQKVVAAEAAGAEYVMVPAGNYEAALTAERKSIEIVPIANVGDAIDFLSTLTEPSV